MEFLLLFIFIICLAGTEILIRSAHKHSNIYGWLVGFLISPIYALSGALSFAFLFTIVFPINGGIVGILSPIINIILLFSVMFRALPKGKLKITFVLAVVFGLLLSQMNRIFGIISMSTYSWCIMGHKY